MADPLTTPTTESTSMYDGQPHYAQILTLIETLSSKLLMYGSGVEYLFPFKEVGKIFFNKTGQSIWYSERRIGTLYSNFVEMTTNSCYSKSEMQQLYRKGPLLMKKSWSALMDLQYSNNSLRGNNKKFKKKKLDQ